MLKPRYFNNVVILNDKTLKKSSTDVAKIIAEYKWYKNNKVFRCPEVSDLMIDNGSASYSIEYIHGHTLADLYLDETLPLNVFNYVIQTVLDRIQECRSLDNTKGLQYKDQIASMYEKKTLERLSLTGIDLYSEYVINGERCPKLIDIIKECSVDVKDSDICMTHGDLCFSNIILSDNYDYTADNADPKEYLYFIDPRGMLPDGEMTSYGDYRYDIAKLAHSLIGEYDRIKTDNVMSFRLSDNEYRIDFYDASFYSQCVRNTVFSEYSDTPVIYNIMVHLFLSMIPLHADKPEQQVAMLANALRLYQERKMLI